MTTGRPFSFSLCFSETLRKNPNGGGTIPMRRAAPPLTASEFCVLSRVSQFSGDAANDCNGSEESFRILSSAVWVFSDTKTRKYFCTIFDEKWFFCLKICLWRIKYLSKPYFRRKSDKLEVRLGVKVNVNSLTHHLTSAAPSVGGSLRQFTASSIEQVCVNKSLS